MYKKGDKAFFNNGLVEILEDKGHGFYLVKGYYSAATDKISGRSFCTPCNIGGPGVPNTLTHTCDEAQEIIDLVFETLDREQLFFAHIDFISDAPLEYVQYKKLKEEIAALQEEKKQLNIDANITEARKLKKEIEKLSAETQIYRKKNSELSDITLDLQKKNKKMEAEIKKLEEHKIKLTGEKKITPIKKTRFEKLELE